MYRRGFYSHTAPMRGRMATANSSGVAVTSFGPCPPGFCWYVERISLHAPTAGTVAHVLVQPTNTPTLDYADRADYTPTAQDDIADELNPIAVEEGYFLNVYYTGCTSGDIVTTSIQVGVQNLTLPEYANNPPQVLQQQAAFYQQGDQEQKASAPMLTPELPTLP